MSVHSVFLYHVSDPGVEEMNGAALHERESTGGHGCLDGKQNPWARLFHQFIAAKQAQLDSAVVRNENFLVIGTLIVVSVFCALFASRVPFTVDEYLVRFTDLSGSPKMIWDLLKAAPLAVDPPLYHFLTSYCLRIFGPSEFATRLPSIFSYVLMSFLLHRFMRRYVDVYSGLTLLLLCLQCGAFPYSYEARPYTLVLAAGSLALICWANLIEQRKNQYLSAIGLFFGIAIAMGSHWFGLLVVIPIAAGELVRTYERREIRVLPVTAILAGASTLLCYLPLLRAASAYRILPWKGVEFSDIYGTFLLVLQPCVFPFALLLIILSAARFALGVPGRKATASVIPVPVFVCVTLFALTPFSAFAIARLLAGAFQPRYALPCTLGLLPLVTFALRDAARRSYCWMMMTLLIIGGYAAVSHYRQFAGEAAKSDTANFANARLFDMGPGLPIASARDDIFLRIHAHGPRSVQQRCVLLNDPSSVRLLHQNTNFLMTEALSRWTSLPIVKLPRFLLENPRFYVIEDSGSSGWLLPRLMEDHATVAYEGTYAGYPVYRVETATGH